MAHTQTQIKEMDMDETVQAWMDQETNWRVEGRRGVETLCTLAAGLGYKDPQRYGQLTSKATLGDLIEMLQDNSGMIEAMVHWVAKQRNSEWKENLQNQLEVCHDDDPEAPKEEDYESFREWQDAMAEYNADCERRDPETQRV